MNIGDAAAGSGLPAKTNRHCEDIGPVRPLRDASGDPAFRDSDMHKLAPLGRALALGFSIVDCRALLALWEDKARAGADVRWIAAKFADLQAMRETPAQRVQGCAAVRS